MHLKTLEVTKEAGIHLKAAKCHFCYPEIEFVWSIVLISQSPSEAVATGSARRGGAISVFLPCAPNPTTGFFFYVPKSKIIEIDMSAEDAATLIMSAGVVQPGSDPQKKIAALAGMANAARVANSSALQPLPAKVD